MTTMHRLNAIFKTIDLYKLGGLWVAEHFDNGETKALMGTNILPTPYFDEMPGSEVLKLIGDLNPDYIVVLRGSQ